MIDQEFFMKEMALLEQRWKPLSDAVFAAYYEILSEAMDNQQFAIACKRVFAEEDFFPSPQKFKDKVQVSTQDMAILEWEKVLERVGRGRRDSDDLSPVARRALQSVGGVSAVAYADIEHVLPRLRRNFMDSYAANSSPVARQMLQSAPEPQQEVLATAQSITSIAAMYKMPSTQPPPTLAAKPATNKLADEIRQKNAWLASGDPILMSEAESWAAGNPSVQIMDGAIRESGCEP